MKLSTLKNRLIVLAAFAMASVAFAQDKDSVYIRNICDSLSSVIEIVPAYVEETDWYGNPQTWTKDSSNFKHHESYKTVKVSSFADSLPLSIQANCRQSQLTTYKYATWNNSKEWVERDNDDFATVIYDIHNLKMAGHDSSNTNNILIYMPGSIPENSSFPANHLLFSKPYEFAFEWWYAVVHYQHIYVDSEGTHISNKYGRASGNDSLKTVNSAISALTIPDTVKSVRIQVLKVVLVDSRKLLGPESSSSTVASSSSEVSSSSSADPVSCSSAESSSSSADPVSCSSAESSSSAAQSSSSKEPESSSSSGDINSCASGNSSSSESASSSSAEPESSSAAEPSSSSDVESSSSEEGPTHIAKVRVDSESVRFVQVRRLDGTVVNNSGKLAPGVYYVKDTRGIWKKMAVMPR